MISFGRKREVNLKVLKVPEIEQKVITFSSDNSRCTPTFCRFYYTCVCAYELKLNFLVATNQKCFFFSPNPCLLYVVIGRLYVKH